MRHGTTADEIVRARKLLSEVQLIGHYGMGYHAEVKYDIVSGRYRVYDHHEMILSTHRADHAAEEYNQIRPKP